MMEINKFATTTILLIINLILIFLFVVPKYQESIDLQLSLIEKQSRYNIQSNNYIKILADLKDINDRKYSLDKINSALPPNFSVAPIVYFLQKEATENQLTVKSITFSNDLQKNYENVLSSDSEKEVRKVGMLVDLSGSYQGLKKFLSSLDESARLFQVDKIYFSLPDSFSESSYLQNKPQTYNFKLEIKTYTY